MAMIGAPPACDSAASSSCRLPAAASVPAVIRAAEIIMAKPTDCDQVGLRFASTKQKVIGVYLRSFCRLGPPTPHDAPRSQPHGTRLFRSVVNSRHPTNGICGRILTTITIIGTV